MTGRIGEEATDPAPDALKDKEDPAEVQTVSQKQLDEKLDEKLKGLEDRLIKKLDTANTGCKCVIA